MNRRRVKLICLSLGVVLFLIMFLNMGKFLIVEDALEKADAIVVFSGDNGPRTEEGVRLLNEGYSEKILLSGGVVYDDVTMAELMKAHCLKLGVDEEAILTEDKSESTYENAIFSREIIKEKGIKSIILATSEYHTRRTRLTMEKALEGMDVKMMMAHSKEKEFNTKWWTSGESVLITLSEYLKLAGYFVKGRI